jgi:hypothetical protein
MGINCSAEGPLHTGWPYLMPRTSQPHCRQQARQHGTHSLPLHQQDQPCHQARMRRHPHTCPSAMALQARPPTPARYCALGLATAASSSAPARGTLARLGRTAGSSAATWWCTGQPPSSCWWAVGCGHTLLVTSGTQLERLLCSSFSDSILCSRPHSTSVG